MTYEEMRTRFAVGQMSAEEGDNQASAFELTRGMADDGSEVFAFINTKAGPKVERYEGPTLRDQFAMAALTGILSGDYMTSVCQAIVADGVEDRLQALAEIAYAHADAMLEARKPKGNDE